VEGKRNASDAREHKDHDSHDRKVAMDERDQRLLRTMEALLDIRLNNVVDTKKSCD
jgi:hypothetical protein